MPVNERITGKVTKTTDLKKENLAANFSTLEAEIDRFV